MIRIFIPPLYAGILEISMFKKTEWKHFVLIPFLPQSTHQLFTCAHFCLHLAIFECCRLDE